MKRHLVKVEYKYIKSGCAGYLDEIRIDGKPVEVPEWLRKNPTVSYAFCNDEDRITGHTVNQFYTKQEFDNLFPFTLYPWGG